VLFLGGWRGPFANNALGPIWLLAKVFVLAFVVIWLRVSNRGCVPTSCSGSPGRCSSR